MTAVPRWSHQTALPAEPLSASKARDFVGRHLVAHGLDDLVEEVRLVASELATNALRHAGTPFVVSLSQADGAVLLSVRDGSAAAPARNRPGAWDVRGRGLLLVERLSRDWGTRIDAAGKSVWASFLARSGHVSDPERGAADWYTAARVEIPANGQPGRRRAREARRSGPVPDAR
jgi:anti-sigma regulatory factor (Ser/Thr protein kinase)